MPRSLPLLLLVVTIALAVAPSVLSAAQGGQVETGGSTTAAQRNACYQGCFNTFNASLATCYDDYCGLLGCDEPYFACEGAAEAVFKECVNNCNSL